MTEPLYAQTCDQSAHHLCSVVGCRCCANGHGLNDLGDPVPYRIPVDVDVAADGGAQAMTCDCQEAPCQHGRRPLSDAEKGRYTERLVAWAEASEQTGASGQGISTENLRKVLSGDRSWLTFLDRYAYLDKHDGQTPPPWIDYDHRCEHRAAAADRKLLADEFFQRWRTANLAVRSVLEFAAKQSPDLAWNGDEIADQLRTILAPAVLAAENETNDLLLAIADDFIVAFGDKYAEPDDIYDWLVAQARKSVPAASPGS